MNSSSAATEAVELPPPGEHRATVVWLHGLGADGHDFEPLVPELRLPANHGIRFVFPHAPVRPVTINGGMAMRAWYDIADTDLGRSADEAGITDAITRIEALLAAEKARGIPAGQLVLAGFSQGAVMALEAGLRHRERLAGLVALSGYLPRSGRLDGELAAANRLTPIFQAHGEADPIIPLHLAERARATIAALRPETEWHVYPMAHAVCAEEIADLKDWLLRVLDG